MINDNAPRLTLRTVNNCMKKSKRKISVGSLSNDHGDGDGDGNENGRKTFLIGLDWQNNNFTRASRFLYISLPSLHAYDVKLPTFKYCGGREHKTTIFIFFSWTSIQSFRILPQKKSLLFAELNEME